MPVRTSAWAIYDVFETAAPDEQLFVGVVSDSQWRAFAAAFALHDLGDDPALATNNARAAARDRILPRVRDLFAGSDRATLVAKLEAIGLPFAPIVRPDQLFDDPHLNAAGGLVDITLPDGGATRLPALPVAFDGVRPGLHHDVPQPGADTARILADLGLTPAEIAALR
jgi:crotonobetainyl-CoA:carnitine CoA-transferase CaiB-like acyl-CoA transferase